MGGGRGGLSAQARGYACIHMQVQLLQESVLGAMDLQPREGYVAGLLENGFQYQADGSAK